MSAYIHTDMSITFEVIAFSFQIQNGLWIIYHLDAVKQTHSTENNITTPLE